MAKKYRFSSRGSEVSPPIDPAQREKIVGIVTNWHESGRLTAGGPLSVAIELRRARRKIPLFPSAAREFLEDLHERGVDPKRVEKVLRGQAPPHIDVEALYWQWCGANTLAALIARRRREATRLNRSYKSLDRRIRKDEALPTPFKKAWKREFSLIRAALGFIEGAVLGDVLKPEGPFTVRMDKPLSRQAFWTPIVVALVKGTQGTGPFSQAFRDVAHLLHLAFPEYPDDPTLVERRYYHAERAKRQVRRSR